MKPKCAIILKDENNTERIGWEHNWKVIYQERGKIHGFFGRKDCIIYHSKCSRCGSFRLDELILPCQTCSDCKSKAKGSKK